MNRKVTSAGFHQSVFLPGIGSIGNAVPVSNKADSKNWKMVTDLYGLVITAVGRDYLVPWANVSGAALGEEIASEQKAVINNT